MIQIIFNDNGKIHTVTFSGEDANLWAYKFIDKLDEINIKYQFKDLAIA